MAQKSLIEELPKILREGKEEASRILERLGDSVKVALQTNELVLPAKDTDGLWKGQVPQVSPSYHSDVFGLFGEGLFEGKPMENAPWIDQSAYLRRQPACDGGAVGGRREDQPAVVAWQS